MAVIVVMCAVFFLIAVESKTEIVHLREPNGAAEVLTVEAADQRYKQTETFVCIEGTIHSTGGTMVEIVRQGPVSQQVYDHPKVRLETKILGPTIQVLHVDPPRFALS